MPNANNNITNAEALTTAERCEYDQEGFLHPVVEFDHATRV